MSAYYESVYVTFDVDLFYLHSHSADFVCDRITSSYCGVAALSEFDLRLQFVQRSLLTILYEAMLTCECCLHFPREVDLFWGRKVAGPYVLFLTNRYLSLLSLVVQLSALGPMSEKVSSINHILVSPLLMTLFLDTEVRESVNNMSITRPELRDLTLINTQLCRTHKRYHNDYIVAVLLLGRSVHSTVPFSVTLSSYNAHKAFSGLRTYALCASDKRRLGLSLGILVFTLSLAPIGVNAVSDVYGVINTLRDS